MKCFFRTQMAVTMFFVLFLSSCGSDDSFDDCGPCAEEDWIGFYVWDTSLTLPKDECCGWLDAKFEITLDV